MVIQENKFAAAEINLVVHATENTEKIIDAVTDNLNVDAARFREIQSQGHFGNKILLLHASLSSPEANSLVLKIITSLNKPDIEYLRSFFENHTDEKGNLYIRLDKQQICRSRISLSESDSIRIRFKPVKRYKADGSLEYLRGIIFSNEST